MFIKNTLVELNFHWISNQEILNFPWKTMKIRTEIMIKINLYMHFLKLVEERPSTMRNVVIILFLYTYPAYFRNFIHLILKWQTVIFNNTLYFIMIFARMYYLRKKWVLKHIIKTTVLVSHMRMCFVVCTRMWLQLWQCQVWQKQFP